MKIEIANLEFAYESTPVLENVSLKLRKGETLAVIGPNASGKTTLLKCINRILKPQEGSIMLNGEETENFERDALAKKMGYVPQTRNNGFPITVFDMVLMGRKPHGGWKPSETDLEVTSKIIDKLGLKHIATRNIEEISGGQLQKVIVARALAQNPEVLLLDEPTSSLDLRHQLEVLDTVKRQTRNGISVVMAMHNLNLAARYSNKFLMLNGGEIFAAGGREVLTPKNIQSVYGVKVSITEESERPMIIPEEPV